MFNNCPHTVIKFGKQLKKTNEQVIIILVQIKKWIYDLIYETESGL